MFTLNSNITLGKFSTVKVHEVKVNRSVYQYTDKAIIKLPIGGRVRQGGKITGSDVRINTLINEGDAVKIDLGYNGKLYTEFEGFIARVNFTTPLQVECEGYSYQLRKQTYLKTFKKTKLLDILLYLIADTDIQLNMAHVVDFEVTKLVLDNHSGTEALELLKKISNNLVCFYFQGKVLNAELYPAKPQAGEVKYKMGWNVYRSDELKKRQASNQDVEVVYEATKQDGSRLTATGGKLKAYKVVAKADSGTFGEKKVIKTSITDAASIQKLADSNHSKLSYDGYEGNIQCFLQPYCEPAWKAIITDAKYPERAGSYLINSTEVTFGMSGARRKVELGFKL
jgi:hypothetical protein